MAFEGAGQSDGIEIWRIEVNILYKMKERIRPSKRSYTPEWKNI